MHFIIVGLGSGISHSPTTDPAGGLQQTVKLLLAKQKRFVLFWPLRL